MMAMSARRALWNWSLPTGLAASSAGTRTYLACRRQRAPQARRNIHVFVVAGEPSGDVLGANLMCALKRLSAEKVRFSGVGGTAMKGEGLEEVFPMSDLSVMGLLEVVPYIPRLLWRLKEAETAIVEQKPDVLVTIDSKGFNFRLLKALAKRGARPRTVVHYVAPSVWAYKRDSTGIKRFLASHLDLLCVLFPFEVEHFRVHVPTACVGPSVLEVPSVRAQLAHCHHPLPISTRGGDDVEAQATSKLLILPGSREQEVKNHLSIMLASLIILSSTSGSGPTIKATVLALEATRPLISPIVEAFVADNPAIPVDITTEDSLEGRLSVMRLHDAALASSGSVSLELAAASTPSVIVYKSSWLTGVIARRIAAVSHVGLPNILCGASIVPECLFDDCTPQNIASAAAPLLLSNSLSSREQRQGLDDAIRRSCPVSFLPTQPHKAQNSSSVSSSGEGAEAPSKVAARRILDLHSRPSQSHAAGKKSQNPKP